MTNFLNEEQEILKNLFSNFDVEEDDSKTKEYQRALDLIQMYISNYQGNSAPEDYPSLTLVTKGARKATKTIDDLVKILDRASVSQPEEIHAFNFALRHNPIDDEYVGDLVNRLLKLRGEIARPSIFNHKANRGREAEPISELNDSLVKLYKSYNDGKLNYSDQHELTGYNKPDWLKGRTVEFIRAVYKRHNIKENEKMLSIIKKSFERSKS